MGENLVAIRPLISTKPDLNDLESAVSLALSPHLSLANTCLQRLKNAQTQADASLVEISQPLANWRRAPQAPAADLTSAQRLATRSSRITEYHPVNSSDFDQEALPSVVNTSFTPYTWMIRPSQQEVTAGGEGQDGRATGWTSSSHSRDTLTRAYRVKPTDATREPLGP